MKNLRFVIAVLLLAACNSFAGDFGRGAKITVRLSSTVSSDRSNFGDPVDAVLVNDLMVNGKLVARAGSIARGIVSGADVSQRGKVPRAGSVSIRMETIETPDGIYHLSTNQYRRDGRAGSGPPLPSRTGGISIDSVGGIQPQVPIPQVGDANGVTVASSGLEAIIPAQSIVTFKAASISGPAK